MREGWNNCKLGELLEIKYGKDHKKLNDGKYPLYGSGGIMRYVDQYLYDDESILIPRKGTLTNLFYLNSPFSTVDTMFWSKINKEKVFPKFLYYLLKTYDFSTLDEGAAIPSLTTKTLKEVLVKIPESLETQRKIASILSGYDDLIENNLKRIKILEEMAQQTYEEWFVRMRFPGYETAVMNEETGLPEGWEKVKLGEIYDLKYGKNLAQTDILKEGTFSVYGASGKMGYFTKSNISSKKVLVTSRGNGSGVVHRTFEDESFVTNNSFVVNTELGLGYTFYNLKKFDLSRFNSGSAQPQLTNSALLNVEIIRPNSQLINDFNLIVNNQIQFIDNLLNQNQRLREARDLLLPRLMMGIVEV